MFYRKLSFSSLIEIDFILTLFKPDSTKAVFFYNFSYIFGVKEKRENSVLIIARLQYKIAKKEKCKISWITGNILSEFVFDVRAL